MLKKIIIFLVVIGNSYSLYSQSITLSDAMSIGLENNFSIKTARNTEKESVINSEYAISGFLPVIDITGARTFDVENVDQQFRTGDTNTLDGAQSNLFNIRGDLTWTIFDGTKMFFDYRILQIERNRSRFETQAVLESTLSNIIQSYYQLVFEQAQYNVLETAIELSQERLDIAQANYEVGRFSKIDFLSAKVDLNTDKTNLLNQEEVVKQSMVTLNLLLGQNPNEQLVALDSIIINKDLELNDLIIDLRNRNKELLTLMEQERILIAQNRTIYTELLPQIDAIAGYGYQNFNSQAGFLLQNQSVGLTYGLSMSWRIFDRLDKLRRTQISQIAIDNNGIAIRELENQLTGNLSSAFVSYQNKITLIELENANVEVAKENADIALDRYKVGRSNALELRESQQNAVEAESRLLNAIYLAKVAEVNLLAISGNLYN